MAQGRFPQLADRDNLWRLLVVITARKALNQIAHERSQRQGGGVVHAESRISSEGAEWGEAAGDHDELRGSIESTIRSRLSVSASVTLVPPGSIERSEMKSRLIRLAT